MYEHHAIYRKGPRGQAGAKPHRDCAELVQKSCNFSAVLDKELLEILNIYSSEKCLAHSGDLAVEHPALAANGHRFEPRKRSKLFQGLISRLTTCLTKLNGAAVSTELFKIKGDVKPPEAVKHSGSDHPQGISAPSFRTVPL